MPKESKPQESLTIEGIAQQAKMGALVQTEGGTVWVDLDQWPDNVLGRKVRVRGHYAARSDLPVFVPQPGEPIRAGMPVPAGTDLKKASTRRVLTDISWELIQ